MKKWLQDSSSSAADIAKELNFPHSTVSGVVKQFISKGSIVRKKGSGGNQYKIDEELNAKILADYKRDPSQSVRNMAAKYKTSSSYIQRFKKKHNLKTLEAVKVPDRDEKQHNKAKSKK